MENKAEDEVRKRWEQEARDKAGLDEALQQRPKKRVRAIEYEASLADGGLFAMLGSGSASDKTATKGRGAATKKPGRAAATRARGKVTEVTEEQDDAVVEID
jgi:hypothetical protein